MIRTPQALIPYMILCVFIAAGALWRLNEDMNPQISRSTTISASIGGPFSLTDQNAMPRTDKDFHGHYLLVYFGYSFCPDVCPTTLAMMADALERLGAKSARIMPVFITIDPTRDSPKVLKQYLAAFGPRFVGLTGSPSAIALAEREYRVYAAKRPLSGGGYAMDHSGEIYLIGSDGKPVAFYDSDVDSKTLAADIAQHIQ
jgi:protein SCO1/2